MPDPHVTIPDEIPLVQYSVGGTPDDEFTIPFSFFEDTDILVYDGEDLIDAADYTVAGDAGTSGGYEGGTVTLDTPVTNTTITILRDIPIERTTDFPLSGPFNIGSLNTQLDKIFAILQQEQRVRNTAITIPDVDGTSIDTELPVAADRAGKVMAFDAEGDVIVSTMDLEDIEDGATDAAASAVAAAASAAAALASETAADASADAADASADAAAQSAQDAADNAAALTANLTADRFSGTGAQTAFTLSVDPGSENNTWVYISGVYQQKDTYGVSGTTLTFSSAPPSGTNNVEVMIGKQINVGVPSDASVTTVKIADDNVTKAKVNKDVISGQTSATLALADAILFGDANDSDNLKKALVTGILSLAYPIGTYYFNETDSTNPATLLGFGTWSAVTDKFIVARGSTYTTTGGAATVTLAANNLPSSIEWTIPCGAVDDTGTDRLATANATGSTNETVTFSNVGGGQAFSIIPPYQAAYIWKRTA